MKEQLTVWLERYLLFGLVRSLLKRQHPTIIGITGSAGKTTTKEAIYHLLKEAGLSVKRTEANLNADVGISLAMLGYNHSPAIWEWPGAFVALHWHWLKLMLGLNKLPDYFVVEMGIDRLGDMKRMVKVIKPKIGILTWVGEGHHLEYLKDGQTVAREKGQMLKAVPATGLSVLPAHDPQHPILKELARGEVVEFQQTGPAANQEILTIVGRFLKIDAAIIDRAWQTVPQPRGRLNRLAGLNDSVIIDDTYNASLPAIKVALNVLAKTPAKRRIAILGDMLEQGQYEAEYHRQVADLARKTTDLFIGVGKRMNQVKPDRWYSSPEEVASDLRTSLRPGDVILIKGSQGMRMEKVSYALAADKEEAGQKLPRQDRRWQQIPFQNP